MRRRWDVLSQKTQPGYLPFLLTVDECSRAIRPKRVQMWDVITFLVHEIEKDMMHSVIVILHTGMRGECRAPEIHQKRTSAVENRHAWSHGRPGTCPQSQMGYELYGSHVPRCAGLGEVWFQGHTLEWPPENEAKDVGIICCHVQLSRSNTPLKNELAVLCCLWGCRRISEAPILDF